MNIGILTFHCAINYGAILQCYALQEVVKKLGHDISVIDYCPYYLKRPYRLFFSERIYGHSIIGNLRMLLRECLAIPTRYKRNKSFLRFVKSNIHLKKMHNNLTASPFDVYIIGSDQIWNAGITDGMDPIYWGTDKLFNNKKRISYAASVGNIKSIKQLPPESVKEALKNFSAVSVREQSLAEYISDQIGIPAQLVLDPVLLAGKGIFEKFISSRKPHKPYLLLFSLWSNEAATTFAKKIAKDKGLEFKSIISNHESFRDSSVITSASPEEFLSHIYNATYVISTSFHGTAFAVLFQKDFNVYCDNDDIGERMYSLLDMINQQERLVDNKQNFKTSSIDWVAVDSILNTKREESILFLTQALKN